MEPTRRFRRADASAYLKDTWGISYCPRTLAKLACIGGGPAYELFGKWPLYRQDDLDEWVRSRLSGRKRSTSDPGSAPVVTGNAA